MKALILAAGLGTRLRPITNSIPKALVVVDGKPLLQHALEHLKQYGIDDVIINVHHFAEQIIDFLKNHHNFNMEIAISDESDELLETGGGLQKASWYFQDGEPFLVRNVDVLSNLNIESLFETHMKSNALATLVVRDRLTSRYLLFNQAMELCGWENRKTEERVNCRKEDNLIALAFSGIQVLNPEIFPLITERGAFPVTDLYLRLATNHPIRGYLDNTSHWKDVGKLT